MANTITIYDRYEAVINFTSKSGTCGSNANFHVKKGMIFHRIVGKKEINSRYTNHELDDAIPGESFDLLAISQTGFFKKKIL